MLHVFRYPLFLLVFLSLFPSAALSQSSDLYIAQGITKVNEGNYKEAIELFNRALVISPNNSEATYYAGLAYARDGQYMKAEGLLLKTLDLDETATDAYLQLGSIYYERSHCDEAEEYLSRYMNLATDVELRNYASGLIESCEEKKLERPYHINLITGIEQDSNVILEPDNPPDEEERKSDIRGVVYVAAGVTPIKTGNLNLSVDYTLYQSAHAHLSNFNVQYHKIEPHINVTLWDFLTPEAGYSLEYIFFGDEDYSRVHTGYGKLTLQEGKHLATEAVYEYRDNRYWDTELFEENSIRSGFQNTLGLRQHFSFDRLSGNLFFLGDYERTDTKYWDYNGFRTGAELLYSFSSWYLSLSGEYNERRYRDDFPDFDERRSDEMQLYTVGITYLFSEKAGLTLSESYTINDSNLDIFKYRRNIVGLFLSLGIL